MIRPAPLPSLLSATLAGVERAYVTEGAGAADMPSLGEWANFLRVLDQSGRDARELPAALRLSQRAVRTRLAAAARRGWVREMKPGPGQTVVSLTDLGSEVVARWPRLQDAAEDRWRRAIGSDRSEKLRACVEELVVRLPLEHPHYPASYGPADASITGGPGQDWKPVPRRPGGALAPLPISALLSQVLVAFAVAYEEKSPVALSLSTAVLQQIPSEGRPLKGLGYSAGIAALQRHGFVQVADGHVFLTDRGFAVRESSDGWIQEVESEWSSQFGTATVARLRRALEDVSAGMPTG